jgi:hypothetical protein
MSGVVKRRYPPHLRHDPPAPADYVFRRLVADARMAVWGREDPERIHGFATLAEKLAFADKFEAESWQFLANYLATGKHPPRDMGYGK